MGRQPAEHSSVPARRSPAAGLRQQHGWRCEHGLRKQHRLDHHHVLHDLEHARDVEYHDQHARVVDVLHHVVDLHDLAVEFHLLDLDDVPVQLLDVVDVHHCTVELHDLDGAGNDGVARRRNRAAHDDANDRPVGRTCSRRADGARRSGDHGQPAQRSAARNRVTARPDAMSATPLLSAAIIVKDEADFLQTCLTSIADVCDEIVVVDTGSTDASVEVAASFGAVQDLRPWDGDFAAARNRALELATGRWILYIDADEQLDAGAAHDIRRELDGAHDAVAFRVWFRARPIWSPYREYRVWRHRPDIRFHGRIHETMVPDIRRIEADEDLVVRDSAHIRIKHHGYEGDQSAKHRRNLPLLEQRVRELPDRCYLWNHLGNIREALGDVEGARQAWSTGIELVRANGLVDRTDVLCYAGYSLSLVAEGRDVAGLVDEMQTVCPWYRTIDWIAAKNHVAQGRPERAIPHLLRLVETGPDPMDDSLAYNNAMFTSWAWTLLAECRLATGDTAGAADAMSDAAAADPSDLAARSAAVALAARARRSG